VLIGYDSVLLFAVSEVKVKVNVHHCSFAIVQWAYEAQIHAGREMTG
jgi:hypothetical protein